MEEGVTTGPMGEELVEPVLTYAHPDVAEGVEIEERGISISGGLELCRTRDSV